MNSKETSSNLICDPCDHEGRPLRFWHWTYGIVETEDYELAIKHYEKLMDKNPSLFSPEGDMLEYWGKEISDFENKRWSDDLP